jgi:NapH/MauN family ferredoxin-type protein
MKKMFSGSWVRFFSQFTVFVVIVFLALTHQKLGIEKAAPIDAYCPFGAVESFFTWVFKGEFLKRIFISSFVLLGIFLLSTLFFGRVFCGYFCPLGALQEWIRAFGRKIGINKNFEFPKKIDKYLRYVKYFILAIIVYFSFYLGDLVFRNYDPYVALMHFGEEFEEKIFGYGVLVLIILAALFSKNIWCRYFCPLGAFFGIVKKIGFLKIKRNAQLCIDCGVCNVNCPANLEIKTADVVRSADCVSCGKCIGNCPKDSLQYEIFGKKISKNIFAWLVIIFIGIPLIVAPYTQIWKTKPESNVINVQGEVNINDIRGSNTLAYIIETAKVPLGEFQKKLGLPVDVDTSLKLKEIGIKYGLKNKEGSVLETEDFRVVIEEYLASQ